MTVNRKAEQSIKDMNTLEPTRKTVPAYTGKPKATYRRLKNTTTAKDVTTIHRKAK